MVSQFQVDNLLFHYRDDTDERWGRKIPIASLGELGYPIGLQSCAPVEKDGKVISWGPTISHYLLPEPEMPDLLTHIELQVELPQPLCTKEYRAFIDVETVYRRMSENDWRPHYKLQVSVDGETVPSLDQVLLPQSLIFGLISLMPYFSSSNLHCHYIYEESEEPQDEMFNHQINIHFDQAARGWQQANLYSDILNRTAQTLEDALITNMTNSALDRPIFFASKEDY